MENVRSIRQLCVANAAARDFLMVKPRLEHDLTFIGRSKNRPSSSTSGGWWLVAFSGLDVSERFVGIIKRAENILVVACGRFGSVIICEDFDKNM